MIFEEFVFDELRNTGNVRAKKMFGTFNICLDNINLGILCENRWYLKKTEAGEAYIKQNNIEIETGLKDKSYVIKDFNDEKMLCELARITCDELKRKK